MFALFCPKWLFACNEPTSWQYFIWPCGLISWSYHFFAPHGNIIFGLAAAPHGYVLFGLTATPHGNFIFGVVAVPHGNIICGLRAGSF
jgi:hypothetical protein